MTSSADISGVISRNMARPPAQDVGVVSISVLVEWISPLLLNCLPEELRETEIELRHLQSQFKDKMKFLTINLVKTDEVDATLKYFRENIDDKGKSHLSRYFTDRLDLEERTLHLRFNKFDAVDEKLTIDEGSDVIKIRISYSSYSSETDGLDKIKPLFLKTGLITDEGN